MPNPLIHHPDIHIPDHRLDRRGIGHIGPVDQLAGPRRYYIWITGGGAGIMPGGNPLVHEADSPARNR